MNRDEHLAWCKTRALEYVEKGDLAQAVSSMISDLHQHPGTATATQHGLGALGMIAIGQGREAMRSWIEGVA